MAEKKKKILVVDDEPILVDEISTRLEINDYEVIAAYDGQEALDKARNEQPDLIILDLMLPKIDGYKVCALLKSDFRYKQIPIIILTAVVQGAVKDLDPELSAEAYMTKPFEGKTLISKIEELLNCGQNHCWQR